MRDGDDAGMTPNGMKAGLARGETVFGTWVHFSRAPGIARMIAAAGFDFAFIDMEHSALSVETVCDLCEMARACRLTPVVRPYSQDPAMAARLLDVGAMGLMFHDVTGRDQVDRLLRAIRYPPEGERGSTSVSTAQDYRAGDGAALKRFGNANTLLAIQIESREGIERIDDILAAGGVDLVQVGRGDLSTDLGRPLETRHPDVLAAVDEVLAACERHGVAAGTLCTSFEDAEDMLARGMRSIAYGSDRGLLMKAYTGAMARLAALVPAR